MKHQTNIKRRFLAGLIDYSIIIYFAFEYITFFGTETEEGHVVNGLPALIPVIFWSIMTVGIEQLAGATFGNGIAGLKPLDEKTLAKPSVSQSFKRHLLDPVDMFMFGLVAFITIKNTGKRLGDLWASTIVVRHVRQ